MASRSIIISSYLHSVPLNILLNKKSIGHRHAAALTNRVFCRSLFVADFFVNFIVDHGRGHGHYCDCGAGAIVWRHCIHSGDASMTVCGGTTAHWCHCMEVVQHGCGCRHDCVMWHRCAVAHCVAAPQRWLIDCFVAFMFCRVFLSTILSTTVTAMFTATVVVVVTMPQRWPIDCIVALILLPIFLLTFLSTSVATMLITMRSHCVVAPW